MEQYKKWLEKQIEVTLEDKDLQREHWAYCTAYKKLIEALPIHGVVRGGVFEMASVHGDKDLLKHTDEQLTANTPTEPLAAEGSAKSVCVDECDHNVIESPHGYYCSKCNKLV